MSQAWVQNCRDCHQWIGENEHISLSFWCSSILPNSFVPSTRVFKRKGLKEVNIVKVGMSSPTTLPVFTPADYLIYLYLVALITHHKMKNNKSRNKGQSINFWKRPSVSIEAAAQSHASYIYRGSLYNLDQPFFSFLIRRPHLSLSSASSHYSSA